jgi:8-amino-3,8-dideoxy-alpha-D-manno-octulosonate transaminase
MPGSELIGKEERDAVIAVFDQGAQLSRRPDSRVAKFEQAVCGRLGARYGHAVPSGTAALLTALRAMGIGRGDEVITQCHTFVATVEAIIEAGAVPVITEVDRTLNMDPDDLESRITDQTRAIIPVHMLGVAAKMDRILSIARREGLRVLEDNAQAAGGTYKGKHLGTLGEAGILSFDFGKLVTTGEGGMVLTDYREIYLRAREYADHGHEQNPAFPRGEDTRRMGGFNFKMMEIPAAIGLVQLGRLDFALGRLRENKRRLKEGIRDISGIEFRELPNPEGDTCDTLVFFLGDAKTALAFAKSLKERGIGTKNLPDAVRWHFASTWDHMLPWFDLYRGKDLGSLWPASNDLIGRAIALPVNILMTGAEIGQRIESIHAIARTLLR